MKTIGLIGGMSWESTLVYYRLINQLIGERMGGLHSAKLWLHSVDFAPIAEQQRAGDWNAAGATLAEAARSLAAVGADCVVLCTNTMHIVHEQVQRACKIPVLHIADATGERIRTARLRKVALLGTRFTMEQEFYSGRLRECFGLDVLTPDAAGRDEVHRVIYDELCKGRILEDSRRRYQQLIDELSERGAEAVILGCTEIALLIDQTHSPVPVFDTTRIHAAAAVDFALAPAQPL